MKGCSEVLRERGEAHLEGQPYMRDLGGHLQREDQLEDGLSHRLLDDPSDLDPRPVSEIFEGEGRLDLQLRYAQDPAPLTLLGLSGCRHEHTDAKSYERNELAGAHYLNGNSFTMWQVPQALV